MRLAGVLQGVRLTDNRGVHTTVLLVLRYTRHAPRPFDNSGHLTTQTDMSEEQCVNWESNDLKLGLTLVYPLQGAMSKFRVSGA